MSQPPRSGNTMDRKRSRWGPSSASSNTRESGGSSATSKSNDGRGPHVSDSEALQALQSEAEDREQRQREDANRNRNKRFKPGRDSIDHPPHGRRNRHEDDRYDSRHRSNDSPSHRDHHRKKDRSNNRRVVSNEERNDDYYGPASSKESSDKHHDDDNDDDKPKELPNFGLSGALSKDTSNGGTRLYKGVVLKFQEPPEARAPNTQWRLYVFKKGPGHQGHQDDPIQTLHIAKQSAYLVGRNEDICDIAVQHASCSSQHAVLQYRALPHKDGSGRLNCLPYLMDLESTNGTFLNGVRIDAARYYQLKKGDVIQFGASTREYVLLTANTTSI